MEVPCAECDHDGERTGNERADKRNICGDEGDDADRACERHVEHERAQRDDRRIEARDDRHPPEVAAQRPDDAAGDRLGHRLWHSQMPIDPPAHRRAVLEQEEGAEPREREPEDDRREPLQAVDRALEQGRDDLRDVPRDRRRRARRAGLIDAGALEPGLRVREGRLGLFRDVALL